jgi:hypothetical protein
MQTAQILQTGMLPDSLQTAQILQTGRLPDLLQAPQILSIRMLPAQEAADITACITQRNPEDILPDAEKKTKKAANGWRWHLP